MTLGTCITKTFLLSILTIFTSQSSNTFELIFSLLFIVFQKSFNILFIFSIPSTVYTLDDLSSFIPSMINPPFVFANEEYVSHKDFGNLFFDSLNSTS